MKKISFAVAVLLGLAKAQDMDMGMGMDMGCNRRDPDACGPDPEGNRQVCGTMHMEGFTQDQCIRDILCGEDIEMEGMVAHFECPEVYIPGKPEMPPPEYFWDNRRSEEGIYNDEFHEGWRSVDPMLYPKEIDDAFYRADRDGSGFLDKDEFWSLWEGKEGEDHKQMPPPEYFWDQVTDERGMSFQRFMEIARQEDPNVNKKEMKHWLKNFDQNPKDDFLNRDEFFNMYHAGEEENRRGGKGGKKSEKCSRRPFPHWEDLWDQVEGDAMSYDMFTEKAAKIFFQASPDDIQKAWEMGTNDGQDERMSKQAFKKLYKQYVKELGGREVKDGSDSCQSGSGSDSDRRRGSSSDSDRRGGRRMDKLMDEMMRHGNPLDMWTDVLHDMFEREVERRVEERMRHMGCDGNNGHHGDDGHRQDSPPAEWYWDQVTDNRGMDRELFEGLARETGAKEPKEELMMFFDMGDHDKDGFLNQDEFFGLHAMA